MAPAASVAQAKRASSAGAAEGMSTKLVAAMHAIAQAGMNQTFLRVSLSKTCAQTKASTPPAAAVMPYRPPHSRKLPRTRPRSAA